MTANKKFMCEAVITLVTQEENTDEATKAHLPQYPITKVFRLEFASEDDFNLWVGMASDELHRHTTPLGVQTGTDERFNDALSVEQLTSRSEALKNC